MNNQFLSCLTDSDIKSNMQLLNQSNVGYSLMKVLAERKRKLNNNKKAKLGINDENWYEDIRFILGQESVIDDLLTLSDELNKKKED